MKRFKIFITLFLLTIFLFGCQEKTYIITFDSVGGNTFNNMEVTKDQDFKLPDPIKEGYDFAGWFDENNQQITTTKEISSNLSLHAQWNQKEYIVNFYDSLNNIIETKQVKHGDAVVAPDTPLKVGYEFMNWDQDLTSVTSNLEVKPVFQLTTYKVTFLDYDGSIIEIQNVKYKKNAIAPNDPVREGYSFVSWDKGFSQITSDISVTAIYEESTNGLEFTLTIDGYSVTKYSGTSTEVVIPSRYDGRAVTKIGDFAFYNNFQITKVVIPNTITEIGNSAFYGCDNLIDVNIPSSVLLIGEYAFNGCNRLTTIVIPSKVIGNSAFYNCSQLKNITILDTVEEIGSWAFLGSANLLEVYIPSSVKVIGKNAFSWCQKLQYIYTSPENVDTLNAILTEAGNIYTKFVVAAKN